MGPRPWVFQETSNKHLEYYFKDKISINKIVTHIDFLRKH